ncbi:sensor histidine kinase [Metaclostridioides mangenotii]|uniref:sensor histidine kinase n=1 Tax=Metaclostridioides mangenotii TaxID=1540 RepID=UPI000482A3AE|nr:HAMP domain-containing sensor histidine kinase [Clostridioides mangenotii]
MFDKLKLKFILINMALLTTVFVTIFVVIFVNTSSNINRQIDGDLSALIKNSRKPIPNSINIVVEVDNFGQIVRDFKPFNVNIDSDKIQSSVDSILKNGKYSGKVNIDDSSYSYLTQQTSHGTKIAFIDRTQYQNLLTELLKTFILIGSLSLVVLLIISNYLTNKTVKPIKDTFEKQKQFIADASHELKTPLTIIKTNASLVLSHPDDSIRNQKKWIDYINDQTDRMSILINEMLSLTKLDTDENRLILSSINMSKIIESMILMFDAVIYESNIDLETSIDKDLFINGDKESIKKLFSIIMDNAIKHTSKNGKIIVSLVNEKNKIKMTINNTGDVIAPDHLERIFERFYRIDSSRDRETGGYGLGLSIARSIVKQHKGKIYAKSKLGEFTSFIVEIPNYS